MSLVGKPAPDFELEGYFTGNSVSINYQTTERSGSFSFFIHLISLLSVLPRCSTFLPQRRISAKSIARSSVFRGLDLCS